VCTEAESEKTTKRSVLISASASLRIRDKKRKEKTTQMLNGFYSDMSVTNDKEKKRGLEIKTLPLLSLSRAYHHLLEEIENRY